MPSRQTPDSDAAVATDGGVSERPESPGRTLRQQEWVRALPFWLPPFLLVSLFVYGAITWNFVISLTDWRGLGDPSYEGLDFEFYVTFFDRVVDGLLNGGTIESQAFRNTIVLLVVFTVASLILGLLLAILIDRGIRLENGFRTIYLLPMSLSFVVTAILWRWMYRNNGGVINSSLEAIGLDALTRVWLGDPATKLFAIIFALTWQFSGYCMVVYLAGLRAIPDEHYEAARVDGASTIKMYWRVILPQLRASTTSAAVVLMVFGLKAFDFIFVIFRGANPGPSADIMPIFMYRLAFGQRQWAYGSTVATVLFLMALGIIAPYLYVQYRRGDL
ncbi:sugar ABC transporter permease [Salinarchaeum sp. Harcht-Bsk1]|nr:sugar ABC transporter permease [Salinarchaeum sp. Harcht-Bsk1]AGN02753.1 sugar ABC transporter permease [Salinarchaeum sp. Harcht-Bsk1]